MALIAGSILYLGFNFLKGQDFFSSSNTYYVWYDKIEGLTVSNAVTVNGLAVGRVNATQLVQQGSKNRILVELQIDKKIQLGDSTRAIISSPSLVGGKVVDLKLGTNTKVFQHGDTLAGELEKSFTQVLSDKATPVMANLDTTVLKINRMLSEENSESLRKTLSNMAAISEDTKSMLRKNEDNIAGITSNLNKLTASLVETEKSIKPLIAKMNILADSLNDLELKKTVAKADAAMANIAAITAKINNGEGSLGALINDKKTVENLNKSLDEISSLAQEFKANPRYFLKPFGTKPKKKKS
ncbi:MAG: MlaD family protein [Cytophagaceae bacterium]|nr:MlaD family protein [Cytophagaceae bacterium]